MSKVSIISFIVVALCVNLQIANTASLFDNPLFNNPLVRSAKGITNTLKNIAHEGEKVAENLGNDVRNVGKSITSGLSNDVDKLKEEGEKLLNGAHNRNTSACNKLYNEIFGTMSQMASEFFSCVVNKTESADLNLHNLTDSAQKLQTELTKDFRAISKCFQDPFNIISCVTEAGHNISNVLPTFERLIEEFYDLSKIFPTLRICYVSSHFEHFEQKFDDILSNLMKCLESVI